MVMQLKLFKLQRSLHTSWSNLEFVETKISMVKTHFFQKVLKNGLVLEKNTFYISTLFFYPWPN